MYQQNYVTYFGAVPLFQNFYFQLSQAPTPNN